MRKRFSLHTFDMKHGWLQSSLSNSDLLKGATDKIGASTSKKSS